MGTLEKRAAALVNPASGLANDYLNHFNQILLMIENMPVLLPEMVDELLSWQPIRYRDYFQQSPLPGSSEALQIYDKLDANFRRAFEETAEVLDQIVMKSIAVIRVHQREDGTIEADEISETCVELSKMIHTILIRLTDAVNHGDAPRLERAQAMADRILGSNSASSQIDRS